MTLVKLKLKSASVVTTMTYVWNTSTNNKTETPSSDKTVKMADGSFKTDNGFVTPYYKGKVSSTDASEVYYYISQPGTSKKNGSTTTDSHVCWYEGDVTIPSNLTKNTYYELSVKSHAEGRGWVNYIGEFSYCKTIQTFIAPIAGTFKLECWGAEGGNYIEGGAGGKGGFSTGCMVLSTGKQLYLCVGQNNTAQVDIGGSAAYNGGGRGSAPGGGCTHIATTNRGVLSNYASYNGEVLLVARGGGSGYINGNYIKAPSSMTNGVRSGHGYVRVSFYSL